MAYNGWRGTAFGPVQTTVTDQPGIGVPGEIAFASDPGLMDDYIVGTGGVFAGAGVTLVEPTIASTKQDYSSLHNMPGFVPLLPTVASAAVDFKGVVVFNEAMQSDSSTGRPGWNAGRVCSVLRPIRDGGRIYVEAVEAWTIAASSVNWVTVAGSDGKYLAGQFAPAALAGDATHGTSVLLAATCVKVRSNAAAGGVVMLEFVGPGA